MLNKAALKHSVNTSIDRNAHRIIQFAQEIEKTPELGFKETKTAAAVVELLKVISYK